MRLSWNEIRRRAAAFASDWAGKGYEKGETQLFYRDFFDIFGVPVRRVATFEEPVRQLAEGRRGFIDLFWRGVLLVEQKSAGRALHPAKTQALAYFEGLRDADLPRYLLLSDFQTFELHDLDEDQECRFSLTELPRHVEKFGFILGMQTRTFREQDPVNVEAAELVGTIHDALAASGYIGEDLQQFLVRIVFCLFADDTGIFEPRDIFLDLLEHRTSADGSDLGPRLAELFQVLDTPEDARQKALDEDLARFPYVNGDLFADVLRIPACDAAMRQSLIDACGFDWSRISPAIFGSLFQSVLDRRTRRAHGAHYTTEANILKVIEPLFLDGLRAEFARIRARRDTRRKVELERFQRHLGTLRFFDPACGCGNFLILAYRELRQLEQEVIRELRTAGGEGAMLRGDQLVHDIATASCVSVEQFYGIELDAFPARIAETALWMMDHIMNVRLSVELGQHYTRIPLRESPHIIVGNALELEWEQVLPSAECTHVLGNPPFIGHQWRSPDQQADMARIWGRSGQVNRLDYVTCWFKRAAEYSAANPAAEIAFVATNSISQGEQVGILWPPLFAAGLSIRFAHRTFQWTSEARGRAAVHCVIVGLTRRPDAERAIYDYDHPQAVPQMSVVERINGYLFDGPNYVLPARRQPPPGRLKLHKGSQPTDGARLRLPEGGYVTTSNLIIEADAKAELVARAPEVAQWLRPYVGGDELISGDWRWCLWLKDAAPSEIRKSPEVLARLERVREGRRQSPTESVRAFADFPTLFTQDRQPSVAYLAIPEVSSETREYIPIAILQPEVIASNKLQIIPGADLFYFGLLTSAMHMAWMRAVAGRLESRYSYSPAVYNSFPWPEATPAQREAVVGAAARVLAAREAHPGTTLEVLYDPDTMPPALRRAHAALDTTVDRLYRRSPFRSERERVEFLFARYEAQATPLAPAAPRRRNRRRP